MPLVAGQADVVQYIAENFQPKFSVITNWASDDDSVVFLNVRRNKWFIQWSPDNWFKKYAENLYELSEHANYQSR